MFRQYIAEDSQDMWPKHVGVVYHKYTTIFQTVVKILSIYIYLSYLKLMPNVLHKINAQCSP
jgi:hypothetical protein